MKKLFLPVLVFLILAIQLKAQVPQLVNYQTVVRNSTGQLVKDQAVGLKFDILKNSTDGQMAYSEKHTLTTNQFGIVNLKIGSGTVLSGAFKDINWGEGKSFLKTYLDLSGGSNFIEMGTAEIVSVPYALYAGSIYVKYSNDTLYIGDQSIYLPGGGSTSGNAVTDFDGNNYDVVTIGNQVWLSSNLKSTHYSDGSAINGVYDYNNNSSISGEYGKLYTWDAAMNGASSSTGSPSGVQGVCPTGFHLPSQNEWAELKEYVRNFYGVGGGLIGQKLKEIGTAHWETANGNNETGFTALGSGHMYVLGGEITYREIKVGSSFWSASSFTSNSEQALVFRFYDSGSVLAQQNTTAPKNGGYPVRCLKD